MSLLDRFRDIKEYRKFSKLLYAGEELEAVALFSHLTLSNGLKHIAMARFGYALMRLGRYGQAIFAYEEAISAELNWGKRKKKANSQYLIAYCEIFSEVASSRLELREFKNWQDRVVYLDCLPASKFLKRYELLLPSLLS